MTNFTRWDPFTDLRQTMDQLFDQGFSRPWRMLQNPDYQPGAGFPVEVWETDDAVEYQAALPGMRPEDVDITVANDVLTIKAENPGETDDGHRNYHRREITLRLILALVQSAGHVDSDKAEANYEHGMLYLKLPKAESVRPKQIKIGVGQGNGHLLT